MNARTCLLCAKPLSRFSVGSGGDFCSRDHRNQYRLRLGMDRLMETNKVASLMRRRENPKHLPVATLLCDSASAPRYSMPARMSPGRPLIGGVTPDRAALVTPHMDVRRESAPHLGSRSEERRVGKEC